jgi:uncharacterized protein (DUF4213/DUF364 family)
MNTASATPVLEAAKLKFAEVVAERGLCDRDVAVSVSALTAEQAIGRPGRRDFPIVEGKERVVEATANGAKGHAFTDSPTEFSGTLADAMGLPLSSNQNRAVFVAVLNAVLRSLGLLEASLHCRDDDPERCAKELADQAYAKWPNAKMGLIGLNPAIAEALVRTFGVDNVRITDLNRENVGTAKFGVTVWDGRTQTEALISQSRAVIMTGTTLVNGTFDCIWDSIHRHGKDYLIYGVTAAGVCGLMGWNGICPYSRRE